MHDFTAPVHATRVDIPLWDANGEFKTEGVIKLAFHNFMKIF